jgi:hypothetical protein
MRWLTGRVSCSYLPPSGILLTAPPTAGHRHARRSHHALARSGMDWHCYESRSGPRTRSEPPPSR